MHLNNHTHTAQPYRTVIRFSMYMLVNVNHSSVCVCDFFIIKHSKLQDTQAVVTQQAAMWRTVLSYRWLQVNHLAWHYYRVGETFHTQTHYKYTHRYTHYTLIATESWDIFEHQKQFCSFVWSECGLKGDAYESYKHDMREEFLRQQWSWFTWYTV